MSNYNSRRAAGAPQARPRAAAYAAEAKLARQANPSSPDGKRPAFEGAHTQDPRNLPEWIQREADAVVRERNQRRQRTLAAIFATLLAGAILIALAALAMLPGELADRAGAPADTAQPIAP